MSKKQTGKKDRIGVKQEFQNNEAAFPEFNIAILRRIASGWAEKHPAIQAIFLFRAKRKFNYEYVLDFIYNKKHSNAETFESWFRNPSLRALLCPEMPADDELGEAAYLRMRPPLFDDIQDAYINGSDIDHHEGKKWHRGMRTPEERNFDNFTIKEQCCFLYPAPEVALNDGTSPIKPEVKTNSDLLNQFMGELKEEIERFYSILKRMAPAENATRELATQAYNESKPYFYFQLKHIPDDKVFLAFNNPRRDLLGRVLQNIIAQHKPELYADRALGAQNYQKLYQEYSQINR